MVLTLLDSELPPDYIRKGYRIRFIQYVGESGVHWLLCDVSEWSSKAPFSILTRVCVSPYVIKLMWSFSSIINQACKVVHAHQVGPRRFETISCPVGHTSKNNGDTTSLHWLSLLSSTSRFYLLPLEKVTVHSRQTGPI